MRWLAALALLLSMVAPVTASEWGQITPGQSTATAVRARYGAPTKEIPQKIEGYDAAQWLYEGAQAPTGIMKLIVDFGLLTPAGYRKDVVRTFRLEPKPEIFNRRLVLDGWGPPTRAGKEGELEFFFYDKGLLVYFEKESERVLAMIFTMPQAPPAPAPTPSPARPAPQR